MSNTYQIRKVAPKSGNAAPGPNAYYIPEFSQNGGSTWNPVSATPFQSLQESKQKLDRIIANEANFNALVLAGKQAPTMTTVAYP